MTSNADPDTMPNDAPLVISPIPAFDDNYFWLIRRGPYAAIVDPGDAAPVETVLARDGLQLCAIVLTHHHRDHIGGVADLLAQRPGLPVYGPRHDPIPAVTVPLGQGDRCLLAALDLDLWVMDVPGHTAGHIAYFGQTREGPVVFCGDTLFAGGCGRVFEGTPAQMLDSLDRLAALPPTTAIYCAHEYTLSNLAFGLAVEPDNLDLQAWQRVAQRLRAAGQPTVPTSINHEARTNPFLRCRMDSVRAAAERRVAGAAADPVATFAALREWKNNFRAP